MHIPIPAKVFLYMVFGCKTMLLVKLALPLQITSQVIIVGEVEASCEVLRDFIDNFCYFFTIKLFGGRCHRRIFAFFSNQLLFLVAFFVSFAADLKEWHEGDSFKSIDSCRDGIGTRLLVGRHVAHSLALRRYHEVIEAVDGEDSEEAANLVTDHVGCLTHE